MFLHNHYKHVRGMTMTEAIVVAFIGAFASVLATAISAFATKKQNNKHSCRQSIMQLITEDHIRALEGKVPENKKAILDEFDEYTANGGNSYIHNKVEEYIKWHDEQNKKVGMQQ